MNTNKIGTLLLGDRLTLNRPFEIESDLLILQKAESLALQKLQNLASSPDFSAKMKVAFGEEIDVTELQAAWAAGDFSRLPAIEVRSRSDINGANGAYAAAIDTIFISQEFLNRNASNVDAIASVVLEEIGHAIDAWLNSDDSIGDEGAIFSALVRGETLTERELAALRAEDDSATVTLDGQVVQIEQATFNGTSGNDFVEGTIYSDTFYLYEGNDTGYGDNRSFPGYYGNDTLYGGDGNDTLYGEYPFATPSPYIGSSDYLDGGNGDDLLVGDSGGTYIYTRGNDTLLGGNGNDSLFGYGYNDSLDGGDGNDYLNGGGPDYAGNNTLLGGIGNDTLLSGNGTDSINGGVGIDVLDYSFLLNGVIVNLAQGIANGACGTDYIAGIEEVRGSQTSDTLTGSIGDEILYGDYFYDPTFSGNDFLEGGSGNDTLIGNLGNDIASYLGASSSVTVNLSTGTATGGAGTDSLNTVEGLLGSSFNDYLIGDIYNNTLDGRPGNDTLFGGVGNDTLYGLEGNDSLDGGDGNDYLHGESNLVTNGSGNDTLLGGVGNDTLYGWDGDDSLDGGTDKDSLEGWYGNDTLVGGDGNDTLHGQDGNDNLKGSEGDDQLYGHSLNSNNVVNDDDTLIGASGNDILDGDNGNFSSSGKDYLDGGDGNDTLYGRGGNDTLIGGNGNDYLDGDYILIGSGNDILIGINSSNLTPGFGELDSLVGGSGADRYILGDTGWLAYDDRNTSTNGTGDYAIITNFKPTEGDLIQLQGTKSNYLLEVSGSDTRLLLDKPGSEPDELVAIIGGVTNLNLDANYFVFIQPTNTPPTTSNQTLTTDEDTNLVFSASNFNFSDVDAGDSLQAVRVDALPTEGILYLDTNNNGTVNAGETLTQGSLVASEAINASRFKFKPDANENGTPYTNFTFSVSDGKTFSTAPATMTLNITPVNDPPTIAQEIPDQTAIETTAFTYQIPANTFADVDDNILAYSISNLPDGLTFNPTTRTISGTPTLNAAGIYNLTVTATDPNGASASDTLALTVINLVNGTTGNDSLNGSDSIDYLNGLAGNDTLNGFGGNDRLDGGEGIDQVRESANVNFTLTNTSLTGNGTDTLSNIETASLTGGSSNNNLNASAFTLGSVTLNGGAGNDTLTGGSANDVLTGGTGNDTLNGGGGLDRLVESANVNFVLTNTSLTGNGTDSLSNIETASLTGGSGNNNLNASAFTLGSVTLNGGAGNDTLTGGSANDVLTGGSGNDVIDGGNGIDRLVESANLNFTLTNTSLTGNGTDSLSNIETASLTGGNGNNTLNASTFTLGSVTLNGGAGNDTLTGGLANDVLTGSTGNDTLKGGNGIDRLVESANVNFVLTNTSLTGNGTDSHSNIESASLIGGSGNNTLNASTFTLGSVTLDGGAGNDKLLGGTGNDILVGRAGNDTLTGGTGQDYFTFSSPNDKLDSLTDFYSLDDTIRVDDVGFGGGLVVGTLLESQFVLGTAAADTSDRFIYNQSTGALFFDSDGTGAIAQVQIATLTTKPVIGFDDIFVI
jgi:Ca2+-binding RTX toxin-like protein